MAQRGTISLEQIRGVPAGGFPQSLAATGSRFIESYDASTGLFVARQPTEADLSLSDITTNNVSTSKHGLVPKLPNDATKYLDGTGAFTVPSGGGGGGGSSFMFPIDEPPASPDTMDDEFSGSSLDAKWTIWNQQAGQTITVGSGFLSLATPYTLQKRGFGVYQAISDSSWKFRTKCFFDALTYQYFGIYIFAQRRTSAVKTLAFGMLSNSGDNRPTGWLWRLSGDDPSLSSESDRFNGFGTHCYLEMEYDGTDITWRYSETGAVFTRGCKESTVSTYLGGEPEYVGIGLHAYSNSTTDPDWGGVGTFDWFRRIS